MTTSSEDSGLEPRRPDACARTFDCLIEGRDPAGDLEVAAHLASCLACFRVRAELAELPELVARLKDGDAMATPVSPAAASGEDAAVPDAVFWSELSSRVADATAASLRGAPLVETRPAGAGTPRALRPARATRGAGVWWGVSLAGVAVALAALVVLTVFPAGRGRPHQAAAQSPAGGAVAPGPRSGAGAAVAPATSAPAAWGQHRGAVDRRIDADDDDEIEDPYRAEGETVADEIADLDGAALRQLARSLARRPL